MRVERLKRQFLGEDAQRCDIEDRLVGGRDQEGVPAILHQAEVDQPELGHPVKGERCSGRGCRVDDQYAVNVDRWWRREQAEVDHGAPAGIAADDQPIGGQPARGTANVEAQIGGLRRDLSPYRRANG